MTRLGRYLNAKNVSMAAIVTMVALFIFAYVQAENTAQKALDARQNAAEIFAKEQDELRGEVRANRGRIEELTTIIGLQVTEISALRGQIRQLGQEPVVVERPGPSATTSTTTRGRSTPPSKSPPTTQPPRNNPPPTTTTTQPRSPVCQAVPALCP